MARECVFCGAAGVRFTREHVWPDWLNDVFESLGFDSRVELRFGGKVLWKSAKGINLTIGICEDCNSGWSSDLESKVRPIIERAITGEAFPPGEPVVLGEDEQRLVATWAVKMWLLLELTGRRFRKGGLTAPKTLRELPVLGHPPPVVQVFLGSNNPPAGQTVVFRTATQRERADHMWSGHYALLLIGTLVLIIYGPNMTPEGKRIGKPMEIGPAWTIYLKQLWPSVSQQVSWPPVSVLPLTYLDLLVPKGSPTSDGT